MEKIFVLDTNVLLHDFQSLFQFANNTVVIPIVVLEELDTFKKRSDEVGKNSRMVARELDELRSSGNIIEGCSLKNGGKLKIALGHDNIKMLPVMMQNLKTDNQILALAKYLKEESGKQVIVVSKDINFRIKAEALNIKAEDYERNKINIEELYSGVNEVTLNEEDYNTFVQNKKIKYTSETLLANECLIIKNEKGESELGIFNKKEGLLKSLKYGKVNYWGIQARNIEQQFAIELLMNQDIRLVTLVGFAGTGKTLLALATGLQQVVNESKYDKLLVSRPIIPLGKDIGYLPGDVEEKLMPRMQPISDNLEFLFKAANTPKIAENELPDLIESGVIELEAVTYIRGRSIPDQFIIVDEAQNLTPHEIKTIITRAGVNTKIVLTGDPYQIDHPYLDSNSNGLTNLVESFKGQDIFGHITFRKGERSDLAELAAELLF